MHLMQHNVRTLCGALVISAHHGHDTFVHLDAGDDAAVFKDLDKRSSIVGLLVEGFVKQDHAADGTVHLLAAGKQQLPVLAPVLLGVLNTNPLQPLAHGGCVRLQRAGPNENW